MTTRTDSRPVHSAVVGRVRGFWAYYRRYTDTAIHAAATAALTAFGLLIFIDPSFAWLAIASYVLPPAVLYAIGSDVGGPTSADVERPDGTNRPAERRTTADGGGSGSVGPDGVNSDFGDPDLEHGGSGVDAGDSDGDTDGVDRDADGTDFDADGPDYDHDGSDRDADGIDTDADGPDLDRDG